MTKRKDVQDNINKAARIALLVLIHKSGNKIDTRSFSELFGISMRTAQRDRLSAYKVDRCLDNMLEKYAKSDDPLSSVQEAAQLLGLNEWYVKILAKKINVGQLTGKGWRFTKEDIEAMKNRPNYRKKKN